MGIPSVRFAPCFDYEVMLKSRAPPGGGTKSHNVAGSAAGRIYKFGRFLTSRAYSACQNLDYRYCDTTLDTIVTVPFDVCPVIPQTDRTKVHRHGTK